MHRADLHQTRTTPQPIGDFYSELKNKHLIESEYAIVENAWHTEYMTKINNLLIWYINLDITPFQTATAKYIEFYCQQNIDMFKMGVSVPGLTILSSFKFLVDGVFFSLFTRKHNEVNDLMHEKLVGGRSIVFC